LKQAKMIDIIILFGTMFLLLSAYLIEPARN